MKHQTGNHLRKRRVFWIHSKIGALPIAISCIGVKTFIIGNNFSVSHCEHLPKEGTREYRRKQPYNRRKGGSCHYVDSCSDGNGTPPQWEAMSDENCG